MASPTYYPKFDLDDNDFTDVHDYDCQMVAKIKHLRELLEDRNKVLNGALSTVKKLEAKIEEKDAHIDILESKLAEKDAIIEKEKAEYIDTLEDLGVKMISGIYWRTATIALIISIFIAYIVTVLPTYFQ